MERNWMSGRTWARGLSATFLALALAAPGCTTNPATGKRILTFGISREEEISLGAQAAPEFTNQFGGPVPDQQLQGYVREVGARLAAQTEGSNPSLPWEFTFLNSDVINAFALPGGKVFFTRGLAKKLTSEAQMAGVLGHEVGHVTAQHGAQRIAQSTLAQGALVVAAVVVESSDNKTVKNVGAAGIPALQIGGQLLVLSYGRDEELEADGLGMRYMSRLGYNPAAQGQVMEVLKQASAGNSQPEWLSTHPAPESRIQQVNKLLSSEYAHTQGNPEFKTNEDAYRRRMLTRLALMDPAPDSELYSQLGPPTLWCAHCREEIGRR